MQYALLLLALVAPSLHAAESAAPSLDSLRWLSGCWAYSGAETGSGEQWTLPAGNTILGVSRTVRDGRTAQWEFLRIEQRADGTIAYVALPSGQSEASFPMTELDVSHVLFENRGHDFPQRIGYARTDTNNLTAHIEGTIDGKPKRAEWQLRRVACP